MRPTGVRPAVPRTKVDTPRLSARHLTRSRLLAHLDEATEGQLVLVSAPAGYGKTVLLADWVRRRPGRTAWLTLDEEDDSDRRFWSAVLAALATCPALPTAGPLADAPLPAVPSRDPVFLAAVIDALDAAPETITLVLDDVHELTHPDPLHGLVSLVRDRPRSLQLVLSTRADPPVRLHRMRLAGELCEVRAADLALSLEETATVLADTELPLRADQIEAVRERTEGWPVGVRLAALSIRESGNPDRFLSDLVDNGRALSDYLVGEILSRLPTTVTEVLHAVSVCDQVTAPLAVAVAARPDAGDVLAALEHDSSLVTSYGEGRRWFRVHPLLRVQLAADLRRRRPDLAAASHARATDWYRRAGRPSDALRHAVASGDVELLTTVLREDAPDLVASGQHAAVCAAVTGLPAEQVRGDARLALVAALAHLEFGQPGTAAGFLADAEVAWPAEPDAALVSLRAMARARRDRYAARWGAATGPSPEDEPGTDAADLVLQAAAAMAQGRLTEAETTARRAADRAGRDANPYLEARAVVVLAAVAGLLGDYPRMTALAERAGRLAPPDAWRNTVSNPYARSLLAYGALLRAQPRECLRLGAAVDAALDDLPSATRAETTPVVSVLAVLRAAARFDLGERRAALAVLADARGRIPPGLHPRDPGVAIAAVVEHDAACRLGLRDHARTVLDWVQERLGPTGDVRYLRARGPALISRYEVAREHLGPVLDGSAPAVVPWVTAEAWLLECEIALRTGHRSRAGHALGSALDASARHGVLRPLVTAADDVAELLASRLGGLGDREPFARVALDLRRTWRHQLPATPLTERERVVLDLLPALLSLDEIAEAMTVSVNTVKSHVRGIYRKLGATSRAEALVAARRAGLIVDRQAPAPVDPTHLVRRG